MKTYLDCIPCFFKQALEASRLSGAKIRLQKRILDEVSKLLPDFPLSSCPPEMGREIHRIVKKLTRKKDPYLQVKQKSNKSALKLYPMLKRLVFFSEDRLLTAVELAIAGNIIDYGVKNSLDVDEELKKILKEERNSIRREDRKIFRYRSFKEHLHKAKNILYLADNAGEVVFDRILIEEIRRIDGSKKIIYAVKDSPIINDALAEDAYMCGIDKIAEIVSSGIDAPGTILSLCSKEFMKIYKHSDMIISKGQGNFEGLSEGKRPIFFLFMAKCPVVVQDISNRVSGKCNLRDIVLLDNTMKVKR